MTGPAGRCRNRNVTLLNLEREREVDAVLPVGGAKSIALSADDTMVAVGGPRAISLWRLNRTPALSRRIPVREAKALTFFGGGQELRLGVVGRSALMSSTPGAEIACGADLSDPTCPLLRSRRMARPSPSAGATSSRSSERNETRRSGESASRYLFGRSPSATTDGRWQASTSPAGLPLSGGWRRRTCFSASPCPGSHSPSRSRPMGGLRSAWRTAAWCSSRSATPGRARCCMARRSGSSTSRSRMGARWRPRANRGSWCSGIPRRARCSERWCDRWPRLGHRLRQRSQRPCSGRPCFWTK